MENRDAARARFAELGLSASDITAQELRSLEACLGTALQAFVGVKMRIDRRRTTMRDTSSGRAISIRCNSDYFTDREAVTFNPDGFVGFAGWADDQNIRPFLDGFSGWCDAIELARKPAPAADEPAFP